VGGEFSRGNPGTGRKLMKGDGVPSLVGQRKKKPERGKKSIDSLVEKRGRYELHLQKGLLRHSRGPTTREKECVRY